MTRTSPLFSIPREPIEPILAAHFAQRVASRAGRQVYVYQSPEGVWTWSPILRAQNLARTISPSAERVPLSPYAVFLRWPNSYKLAQKFLSREEARDLLLYAINGHAESRAQLFKLFPARHQPL